MNRRRSASRASSAVQVVISLAIVGIGLLVYLVLPYFNPPPATEEQPAGVVEVMVRPVLEHEQGFTLESDGVVVPYREITVSAEVGGRVVRKSEACRAGRFVTVGTVLVEIDDNDYQLEVDRLNQELTQADVMLNELEDEVRGTKELLALADEEVALREREVKRQEGLAKVSSVDELERAQANRILARNSRVKLTNQEQLLETRRYRLKSACELVGSQLRKAQLDLERTKIKAPIDGVIVDDKVEVDSFVQRGTVLFAVEDTSKVEVSTRLNMEDLFWLWNDRQSVRPELSQGAGGLYELPPKEVDVAYRLSTTGQEYHWQGRLARYESIGLDEKTRTVPCRIVVDDPRQTGSEGPPALVRGMYVTVRLQVAPRTALLRLPEQALRPGNRVWRVANGRLDIIPVRFVKLLRTEDPARGDDVIVCVDGEPVLGADDQVVVSPLSFVRSGMQVRVNAGP